MVSSVSVVGCEDYIKAREAVRGALDLLEGLKNFAKPGDKVLLKPNLIDPLLPEKAATTHPLFVKAVIELFKDAGCEVCVGDSAGGSVRGITRKVCRISGIKEIIEETGVLFRNFQEEEFVVREIPHHQILEKTDFAKAIFETDLIVNLPKLKTHGQTFLTGAVKNCFGCIHPNERIHLHEKARNVLDFSKGLVDVFSVVKPKLSIIDAVVGMEGDEGPSHGDPKQIGLVMASTDAVALDAVASEVVGYRALGIPTTRIAHERELGKGDLKDIRIIGKKLKDAKISDFVKTSLFYVFNPFKKEEGFGKFFVFIPEVDKDKCIKCGECAVNCPVGAITLKPFPTINKAACIHCYCCHELCSQGAFKMKKEWLMDVHSPYMTPEGTLFLDKEYKDIDFYKIGIGKTDLKELVKKITSKKPRLAILSFRLKEKDLKKETGETIKVFLKKLRENGNSYMVMRALPRCLFGFDYNKIAMELKIPKFCRDCTELFSLQKNGMIKFCEPMKNKIGPKLEYMKDRNQVFDYFWTFYEKLKPAAKCESCLYFMRRQCTGICLRS